MGMLIWLPFLERVRSFGIQKLLHGHTNLLQEQDSNLGRRGGKQLPATWTIAFGFSIPISSHYPKHHLESGKKK